MNRSEVWAQSDVLTPCTAEHVIACMEGIMARYDIDQTSLMSSPGEVAETAADLLTAYRTGRGFFRQTERVLMAMAVADGWCATQSQQERDRLSNVLKLVSIGKPESGGYVSFSGLVRSQFLAGASRAALFDPRGLAKTDAAIHESTRDSYVKEHFDPELSGQAAVRFGWGHGAELDSVRERLGIHDSYEELPFEVRVLSTDGKDVARNHRGANAWCSRKSDRSSTIVLPCDFSRRTAEHEYAHAQSQGLNRGHQRVLFRGLDEGITESLTSDPQSYQEQMGVSEFLGNDPVLKHLMHRVYMGEDRLRRPMLSRIIELHGVAGMLSVATMRSAPDPRNSTQLEALVSMDPVAVFDALRWH